MIFVWGAFFDVEHFKVFIEFVTTLLLFYILVFFCKAYRILATQPGIEPTTPAIEDSLNLWTAKEVSIFKLLKNMILKSYDLFPFLKNMIYFHYTDIKHIVSFSLLFFH